MKAAIIISGHLRNFEACYPNLKSFILDKFSSDVFIHTWSNLGMPTGRYKSNPSDIFSVDKAIQLYSPVKVVIEDFNKTNINLNYRQVHGPPLSNIIHMFRKMYLADQMRQMYESYSGKYDIVIRARPDLTFSSAIPDNELECIGENIFVPELSNQQSNDHFAFSTSENMKNYFNVYPMIDSHYDPDRQQTTGWTDKGCAIHAETLLRYHLETQQVKHLRETNVLYRISHK